MANKSQVRGTATVRKSASVSGGNRIPTRFDRRAFTQENVNANELEVFQPDPRRGINRNYRDNPFQGNEAKKIVAVGLSITPSVIRSDAANGIDALQTLQTLENSAITLGKGDREETIHRLHTTQVTDFHDTEVVVSTDGAGNDVELVHFSAEPGRVLHEPNLVLDGDERFHYTLHLSDGFVIPSQADFDASAEPTTNITAFVQFERLG